MLEQSPINHLNSPHQKYYHQEHITEQSNKIPLTLILPNGVQSVINVDAK